MRKVLFSALLGALSSVGMCQLRLQPYVSGLTHPVAMAQDPSRQDVQYIVQKEGLIRVILKGELLPTPFIDLSGQVKTDGEGGLLGLAFPADYDASGYAYLFASGLDGTDRIWRYTRANGQTLTLDPTSAYPVLQVSTGSAFHHGGTLHFGPDGFLYVGAGDRQSGQSQNPTSLRGKMLRIDPTGDDFPDDTLRNYRIPSTNPFVNGIPITALGEIWDFGLRNPWKWSFDSPQLGGSGALVIGDVGQDSYEEVDFELPGVGGANYGWPVYEGPWRYSFTSPAYYPLLPPTVYYSHSRGGNAITGGYVYRGSSLGSYWTGRYFFADSGSSRCWTTALPPTDPFNFGIEHTAELGLTGFNPTSIDVDSQGELYFSSYTQGTISKLVSSAVTATALSVNCGSLASGGLADLSQSDDQRLVVDSQAATNAAGQSVDIRLETTAPAQTATTLRFFLEAQVSGSGLDQSVDLWDFNAGEWIQLDARAAGPTDDRVMLTATDPNRFIESGTRTMRARIRYWRGSHDGTAFAARIDQSVWGFYP